MTDVKAEPQARSEWADDDENAIAYVEALAASLQPPRPISFVPMQSVAKLEDRWTSLPLLLSFFRQLSEERPTTHWIYALGKTIEAVYEIGAVHGAEAARGHMPPLEKLEAAVRSAQSRKGGLAEKTKPWHDAARRILKRELATNATAHNEIVTRAIYGAAIEGLPKTMSLVEDWVSRERNKPAYSR